MTAFDLHVETAPWARAQRLRDQAVGTVGQTGIDMQEQQRAAARGGSLLFLHVDTRLPDGADSLIAQALRTRPWGRFDVQIEGRHPMLRMVAAMMNLRSRITGIATGDQAMFMSRAAFEQAGGFPAQPLMEDIELSTRLRRIGRPACLAACVVTSGRRWERDGAWRTILLMWRLRFAYWRGAPPADLHRRYYGP